ncbi:MAG: hypothetical protein OIN89_01605 [Candidatus Methanoperedens sp.]|jgi:hypothetical protein|nr:hypothetical protein [Candidatus Methanoperedens sp.]PKL54455.1 MAG: hypothetical protein CVV36_01575 [Candidatus Methanoperedenaceae archaeon HGW-Methanoperedenaceae-1]
MNIRVMKTIELLSLILVLSLAVQGCIGETPEEPATPAAIPNETVTAEPTGTASFTPAVTPEAAPAYDSGIPVTYILSIDSINGFKKIRAFKDSTYVPLPPDFDILNFTIKNGDSVRWVHDDSYNFPLTLVSNEGLWTNRTAYLRWQDSRFEYAFNESGTYSFSIKGYPRLKNQTIVVTES